MLSKNIAIGVFWASSAGQIALMFNNKSTLGGTYINKVTAQPTGMDETVLKSDFDATKYKTDNARNYTNDNKFILGKTYYVLCYYKLKNDNNTVKAITDNMAFAEKFSFIH